MKFPCSRAACLAAIFMSATAAWGQAEVVKVITRQTAVRGSCRFFAAVVVRVQYGDLLALEDYQGDWVLVSFDGARGCIHSTAVQEQLLSLSRLAQENVSNGDATVDEVSLAGKGFNPQVEAAYRQEAGADDFLAVEAILRDTPDSEEHASFLTSGGLVLP